ncbi:MAG: CBS domain-containing protein [Gaiellaceae bacterium]
MSLRDITLVPASVPESATFREAATALRESGLPAIAVVNADRRVVGLFTDVDLLRGLFPAYLKDLHHTAFLPDDPDMLTRRAHEAAAEPVAKHSRRPHELELETSATHAAERFLHCEEGAIPVVDEGRFVGMLPRTELALAMLRRRTES